MCQTCAVTFKNKSLSLKQLCAIIQCPIVTINKNFPLFDVIGSWPNLCNCNCSLLSVNLCAFESINYIFLQRKKAVCNNDFVNALYSHEIKLPQYSWISYHHIYWLWIILILNEHINSSIFYKCLMSIFDWLSNCYVIRWICHVGRAIFTLKPCSIVYSILIVYPFEFKVCIKPIIYQLETKVLKTTDHNYIIWLLTIKHLDNHLLIWE